MSISRKETAWKKSRKFGDVKGGRSWPKVTDNIIARLHSLERPGANDELPIFIRDNPSRDFYYPADESEIAEHLQRLPAELSQGVTHIWLRRVDRSTYESGDSYQGMYIYGSGVKLIVLNAFPRDLRMHFGNRRPSAKAVRQYLTWQPELKSDKALNSWYLQWETEKIKDYFLNSLLLHELGHFNDQYRHDDAKSQNYADMFAIFWKEKLKEIG